ncbi:hypothetical protein D6C76_05385 [Aureobasidium pullulans]|nr:hypothetical protein D6C76_05385 [Aureobasidium pullulans]
MHSTKQELRSHSSSHNSDELVPSFQKNALSLAFVGLMQKRLQPIRAAILYRSIQTARPLDKIKLALESYQQNYRVLDINKNDSLNLLTSITGLHWAQVMFFLNALSKDPEGQIFTANPTASVVRDLYTLESSQNRTMNLVWRVILYQWAVLCQRRKSVWYFKGILPILYNMTITDINATANTTRVGTWAQWKFCLRTVIEALSASWIDYKTPVAKD